MSAAPSPTPARRTALARACRAMLAAAAVASAVLGLRAGLQRANMTEPAAAAVLAPLAGAPLVAGERAALAVPVADQRAAAAVLFEASWRRPDVRWGSLEGWPAGAGTPQALVTLAARPLPSGWRPVWRAGELVLARPERP